MRKISFALTLFALSMGISFAAESEAPSTAEADTRNESAQSVPEAPTSTALVDTSDDSEQESNTAAADSEQESQAAADSHPEKETDNTGSVPNGDLFVDHDTKKDSKETHIMKKKRKRKSNSGKNKKKVGIKTRMALECQNQLSQNLGKNPCNQGSTTGETDREERTETGCTNTFA